MKLRARIGRKLLTMGMKWAEPVMTPTEREGVNLVLAEQPEGGAVVEADGSIQTWQPHQKGNVVVAEPLIMTQYRRQGGSEDDV